MKKILMAIAVLGLVAVAACSNEKKANQEVEDANPQELAVDVESVTPPTDTLQTDSGTAVQMTTTTVATATTE